VVRRFERLASGRGIGDCEFRVILGRDFGRFELASSTYFRRPYRTRFLYPAFTRHWKWRAIFGRPFGTGLTRR